MVPLSLENKIAVVTGASEGIGLAIAKAFSQKRAHVVLASRNAEKLKRAASEFDRAPLWVPCDVSKPEAVQHLRERVLSELGPPDILVNNAGISSFKPVWEISLETWRAVLDTNLTGTFLVTRAFLPEFMSRKSGHIVNIVSVAGISAFTECAAYCASKYGQLGLTRVLRQELIPYNVRVTAVLPGATDTAIWDGAPPEVDRSVMMRPEDIARSVVMACELGPNATVEEIILRPTSGDV